MDEQEKEFKHVSVLLQETVDNLCVKPSGIYVDGTLGGGGHASVVCSKLTDGRFIGIDQDADAIRAASKRLEAFPFVTIVRNNYCNMREVMEKLGVEGVDDTEDHEHEIVRELDHLERSLRIRLN